MGCGDGRHEGKAKTVARARAAILATGETLKQVSVVIAAHAWSVVCYGNPRLSVILPKCQINLGSRRCVNQGVIE